MAFVAGHLRRTMSPNTDRIGKRARKAKIPKLMNFFLCCLVCKVDEAFGFSYIHGFYLIPGIYKTRQT